MNVIEAIQQKRSVRNFTNQPVPDEVISQILSAGRRAQSSKNTQPWHFICVRDRERLHLLSQMGDYLTHVDRAALCVCIVTSPPTPNRADWVMFDAGQCAAYMQLAAFELGVGSVLGAIYKHDAVREFLGFPPELRLEALISFGYPAPEEVRPLKGQGRRPLEEIIHWEKW